MPTDQLWVCHACRQIGNGFEAGRHVDATGHQVEQLSVEMSGAVREYQRRESSAPTAGDFMAYAEFQRKAAAAHV